MSLKLKEIVCWTINLFVITVILILFVRYNHEILLINYAKPNQKHGFVRYNREFAITVIAITEFDCMFHKFKTNICEKKLLKMNIEDLIYPMNEWAKTAN